MLSDVVAETTVVPIAKEAVEPVVDALPAPRNERLDLRNRHGQSLERKRGIHAPRVLVVLPVCLLPPGCLDFPAVDFDPVELARMKRPGDVELAAVEDEGGGKYSLEKFVAGDECVPDQLLVHRLNPRSEERGAGEE